MSMSENLTCTDLEAGITRLELARVPVNALNPEYLGEIGDRLAEIESNADVRTVVITSALPVFSAGMDLKEAQQFSVAEQTAVVDGLNSTFSRLYGISKPVVVAVNRAAIAGGLFFALAADYVVAGAGAKFGLTEVRVGVDFPAAPLQIARAELTPQACRRLMLGGGNLDALTARDMGIVDEVVEAESLVSRAVDVARDYATIPALAYAAVKSQLRARTLENINKTIEAGSDPTRDHWFTEETRDAMRVLMAAATGKS